MRRTARLDANARSSRFILAACVLTLALAPVSRPASSESRSLSQEIITYGFLVRHYPDNFLLASEPATTQLERDMRALGSALNSLGCDVPKMLAFPHRATIVPSSATGLWLSFPPRRDVPSQEGLLFVVESTSSQRTLVIFSRMGPDETTIFWVEEAKEGFSAELLYDSFKKGKISNAPNTNIGAITAVSLEKSHDILLKEWAEPGSRSGQMGEMSRVFRLDLSRDAVTLVSPGILPQH